MQTKTKKSKSADYPSFIWFASEKLRKPVSKFTKIDWKRVAVASSEIIDIKNPAPKSVGRPRKKTNRLSELLSEGLLTKRKQGRPKVKYYGLPAEEIDLASRKFDVSIDRLLTLLQKRVGGYSDPASVRRAIRRLRADKTKKKSS